MFKTIFTAFIILTSCASPELKKEQPPAVDQKTHTVKSTPVSSKKDIALFFCETIQNAMTDDAIDSGMDMKKCLTNKTLQTKKQPDGTQVVTGKINFKSHSTFPYTSVCKITFKNEPKPENIIGPGNFNSICEN